MKNPRCPFHVSWKILIPYSGFQKYWTEFRISQHASFPKLSISEIAEFRKNNICKMMLDFLVFVKSFGGAKVHYNGFWGPWTFPPGPNIMKIMTFLTCGEWKLKVTCPKWSRIILRSFWALQSSKYKLKIARAQSWISRVMLSINPLMLLINWIWLMNR